MENDILLDSRVGSVFNFSYPIYTKMFNEKPNRFTKCYSHHDIVEKLIVSETSYWF